jgi:hypothetical protein
MRKDPQSLSLKRRRRCLHGVAVAIHHVDARAGLREPRRNGPAEPASGAGDDRDLSCQLGSLGHVPTLAVEWVEAAP